jgi:SAM-dependent methyltransferase
MQRPHEEAGLMPHSVQEIADGYNRAFPDRPPLIYSHGWLYGVFMIGNDYRNKTRLYGAYPHGLLDRYGAMFNIKAKVLHIFSGSLPPGDYTRVDIKQDADIKGDVQELSKLVPENHFDLVFADPPYTKADADKYGTKMPNKKKVIHEVYKVLKPGGLMVWLDTQWPMFRKSEFHLVGTIGLIRSTNHRVRFIFISRKVEGGD